MRCNNDCLICTPFLHIFQHFIVHTSFLPSTCPLFPLSSAERDSENIVVTDVIYTLSRQSLSLSLFSPPSLPSPTLADGRHLPPSRSPSLPPSLLPPSLHPTSSVVPPASQLPTSRSPTSASPSRFSDRASVHPSVRGPPLSRSQSGDWREAEGAAAVALNLLPSARSHALRIPLPLCVGFSVVHTFGRNSLALIVGFSTTAAPSRLRLLASVATELTSPVQSDTSLHHEASRNTRASVTLEWLGSSIGFLAKAQDSFSVRLGLRF